MTEEMHDGDDLLTRLIGELEEREQQVSSERRELHRRIDTHGDELARRREPTISKIRRELHKQIDDLRGWLTLLRRPSG
jgi:hypothetical protein